METETVDLMTGAKFSEDGKYRYSLWRFWNYRTAKEGNARAVMFIMANPSTAGKYTDDPTTQKCAKYAQSWGYDGMYIGNLYARIDTHSLFNGLTEKELIGAEADEWLGIMRNSSSCHVAAWGFMGKLHPARVIQVRPMFPELYHLGISKDGQPKHPLYLPKDLRPTLWE